MANTNGDHDDSETTGDYVELLSLMVNAHEYAVDIMSVKEIRGWTTTTSLPHSPDYVQGVINLRGTVLPVIDLALRLGLESNEPDARNVVIVVDADGKTIGIRVDAVSDILSVKSSELRAPPELSGNDDINHLRALTIVEDRMIRVLDLESVLPGQEDKAA